ncbi:acyl carrier protein [Streptomyces alfalfae]|uniref:Acyl carrier protein n=1 Tax=Streptomyces alfalfae TaxID=1642299 RepID=A0ABM6H1R9_9ACTN|nr:acyl carrier protein [Streptomyces alfalfae]AYA20561.1 acyl carrier protein [Streptomyces fradiae]APY90100.1 acyl carrier protein [Streptomyces alfalfae]QUI29822.1 acyl carrier protein [Streptomyces alfalfae]RXX34767.1 acyl carrier protein [Streptomyces alfalfae]RZM91544.1 acyl carrier protein [Streptomyces alfalfae]
MQAEKQEHKRDQELFDKIVKHIGEFVEADVSHLTPQSNIGNSIEGMSSLKMVELLLFLEDCFGVDFDESVMDDLQTMGDLEQYIRRTLDASEQRA